MKIESSFNDTFYNGAGTVGDTVTTWTVGGGIELAFSDPNWSIKAEYMYIGLDQTLTPTAPVPPGTYALDNEFGGIHTAKIGLNYRFGGFGAPVVAKD